jgi:hypothetical protein
MNLGNVWLGDRLLSIRQMMSYNKRNTAKQDSVKKRLVIYGFPVNMGDEFKNQVREYFSSLGKLKYYYYVRVNIRRVGE